MEKCHHKVYVGVDVHHQGHKVALIPVALLHRSESSLKQAKFLNIKNNSEDFERLDAAIKEHVLYPEEAVVAVDHTGGHYSEPLVWFLQGRGYSVCHLEPKAVKGARERLLDEESKTDTTDAASIAYLLYLRDVHGISFRISAVTPQLRSKASVIQCLVLQRQQYNKLATQCTNRLHQLLVSVFPEGEAEYFGKLLKITHCYPTPQDIIASENLKGIKNLGRRNIEAITALAAQTIGAPGEIYRELIKGLTQQRNEALAKREAIAELIEREVSIHPYGSILLSFPYLGPISAATMIGVVKDISRWPNKKKLKKAFGVYSTLKQSGTSPGKGRLGKEGSRHGRRALFQVVLGCIRSSTPDNDFKDYYLRQVARGKPKLKALVSTMGKLAEIIYHCLSTGESYQYQGNHRSLGRAVLDR